MVCAGLLSAACGGGKAPQKPLPVDVTTYQQQLDSWSQEYANAGFRTLDRDYRFCLGPNDPPQPPSTPDPSGHTRARIPCADAVRNIEPKIPQYQTLIDELAKLGQGSVDPRVNAAESAQMAWHTGEIALYRDAVDALHKGDPQALVDVRQRYIKLADLETAAIQAIEGLTQHPK